MSGVYSVYILRCVDGSLYTGIAIDVEKRLEEHADGPRGAKYLRGRTPLELLFRSVVGDRSAASRVEHQIKKLRRVDKLALIDGRLSIGDLPAGNEAYAPGVSAS